LLGSGSKCAARTTSRIPKKKAFPSRKKGAFDRACCGSAGSKGGLATVLGGIMKILSKIRQNQTGAIGWILLWAIGVPIPILFLLIMVRGCT